MKEYEKLIATPGVYGHITRKGAGTPGSMEILATGSEVYNPADGSFAYLIIPGADGVKFSIMEEDGVRVSAARVGFTYPAGMNVTGRFNRLKIETGACAIYTAHGVGYVPEFPALGQIARTDFRTSTEGQIVVPLVFPKNYALFEGEDFGFIVKIEREGMDDLADFDFGDILVRDADNETLETLNAYGHANTELIATLVEGVATYYIAKSNTNLSGNDVYDALKDDDATNLLINLELKVEGNYKISVAMVEMNEETNVLETSGNIFSTRTTEITVPEASEEAEILSFEIEHQVAPAVIDSEEGTIEITMPHGTNVTALVATFAISPFAESIKVGVTDQVSGTTANDFTEPVVYTVMAEDGETDKDWTVTIEVADPSEEADILTYSIPGQMGNTKINTVAGEIEVLMPHGTNVTALVATFTTSAGITSILVGITAQVSGTTANNFTTPVDYVVLAQDGETDKTYTVTVVVNDL